MHLIYLNIIILAKYIDGQSTIYDSVHGWTFGSLCMCLACRLFNRCGKLYFNGIYTREKIIHI